MIDLPFVTTITRDGKVEGAALLLMQSILKADLMSPQRDAFPPDHSDPPLPGTARKLQENRETLVYAIRSWPPTNTLELRITSFPHIRHKAQGRCWITLAIRTTAPDEESARERVVRSYLELKPLLSAHWPEAEFLPVTSSDEIAERLAPFRTNHAMILRRRSEELALSAPLRISLAGFDPAAHPQGFPSDRISHTSPWVPSLDDWARLLDVLSGLLDPVTVLVRLRTGANPQETIASLMKTIETCESYLARLHEHRLPIEKQIAPVRDIALRRASSLRDSAYHAGVFLLSPQPIHQVLGDVLGASITKNPGFSHDSLFVGRYSVEPADSLKVEHPDYFPESEPFTADEAACAFRLPSPPFVQIPVLPVKYSRTSLAMLPVRDLSEKGSTLLFVNEHQGSRQPIHSGVTDRMRHVFIIGQTGTGKSTLMENMILQDILAGRGVAVIDPHGDLVENVLASIPPERAEDVVFFDFLERNRPIGFNPIGWTTTEERDLLIDELYMTIDRVYDMKTTGGPIFETNFRGMLKLLMGDGSDSRNGFVGTLLEFVSCYTDGEFRTWLKKTIDDLQIADFVKELERTGGEASLQNLSPYVTSKFSRFVHDTQLRRIIGQERSSFDFDDIINKGKIFLVKLGKGRFGSNVSALLTNMLVTRFKLSAMKRGCLPEKRRRDYFLYVDEAHNLPSDNFMELLSEARKYRMSLVLSTQYCGQLTRRPDSSNAGNNLLSAIHGNVGSTVIFRLGADDAKEMARTLYPYFDSLDIIGLPNYHGFARILVNSESVPPFSFRTINNSFPRNTELADRIRELSVLKYGKDRELVDYAIRARRRYPNHLGEKKNNQMDEDEE